MGSLYDTDLVLWAEQQSRALREAGKRSNEPIDWENVAEEIEGLGRSDRRALASHVVIVLEHLLKLQTSPAADPRHGWVATILRARLEIRAILKESPSLRPSVTEVVQENLPSAREIAERALREYSEQPRAELASLGYDEGQVLGPWLPDEAS